MLNVLMFIGISLMLVGGVYSIYQIVIIFYGINKLKIKSNLADPEYDDFISILIPAKNEEKVIGRCLDSILKQDYQNYEVIVVEDGSTDNTFNICKEYENKDKRIKCYHRDKSNGKPSALNYAFKLSKGNIIATFDADSVLQKNTLTQMLNEMHMKDLDALQGENFPVNANENIITEMSMIDYGMTKVALLGRSSLGLFLPLGGSNQYFKREVLEKLNGWDEKYLTEDLEISLRMKNFKVEYSPSVRCGQETPSTLKEFKKQRTRWFRGYHQTLFHSKKELKNLKDLDSLFVITAPLISSLWFLSLILIIISVIFYGLNIIELDFLIGFGIFLLTINIISIFLIIKKSKKLLKYIPIAYIYWFLTSLISLYSLMLEITNRKRNWEKVNKTGIITNLN
ncbi:MAG: glycosyltransferase [Thermoplasmata archaeon]|jgi:cellulose synthase/poly-beta-1,6-N-acetylglucosamine synthase-like glycosyltransferase